MASSAGSKPCHSIGSRRPNQRRREDVWPDHQGSRIDAALTSVRHRADTGRVHSLGCRSVSKLDQPPRTLIALGRQFMASKAPDPQTTSPFLQWREEYEAALQETDHKMLFKRIEIAEAALLTRREFLMG